VTKRNTRAEALVYLAAQKGAAILHLEECGGEAAAEDLAEAIAEAFPQHIGFGSFAIEPDDIVEMLRQEGFASRHRTRRIAAMAPLNERGHLHCSCPTAVQTGRG